MGAPTAARSTFPSPSLREPSGHMFAELVPRSMYPGSLRLVPRRGAVGAYYTNTLRGRRRKVVFGTLPAQQRRTKRGVLQWTGKRQTFVLDPREHRGVKHGREPAHRAREGRRAARLDVQDAHPDPPTAAVRGHRHGRGSSHVRCQLRQGVRARRSHRAASRLHRSRFTCCGEPESISSRLWQTLPSVLARKRTPEFIPGPRRVLKDWISEGISEVFSLRGMLVGGAAAILGFLGRLRRASSQLPWPGGLITDRNGRRAPLRLVLHHCPVGGGRTTKRTRRERRGSRRRCSRYHGETGRGWTATWITRSCSSAGRRMEARLIDGCRRWRSEIARLRTLMHESGPDSGRQKPGES